MDYGISESGSDFGTIHYLDQWDTSMGQDQRDVSLRMVVPIPLASTFCPKKVTCSYQSWRTAEELCWSRSAMFVGDSPVTFADLSRATADRPNHEPEFLNMALCTIRPVLSARP